MGDCLDYMEDAVSLKFEERIQVIEVQNTYVTYYVSGYKDNFNNYYQNGYQKGLRSL